MHCLPITQEGEVCLHKGDEISKLVTVMSAIIHSQRQKKIEIRGNRTLHSAGITKYRPDLNYVNS